MGMQSAWFSMPHLVEVCGHALPGNVKKSFIKNKFNDEIKSYFTVNAYNDFRLLLNSPTSPNVMHDYIVSSLW